MIYILIGILIVQYAVTPTQNLPVLQADKLVFEIKLPTRFVLSYFRSKRVCNGTFCSNSENTILAISLLLRRIIDGTQLAVLWTLILQKLKIQK